MKRTTQLVFAILCITMLQVKAQTENKTNYNLKDSYSVDISEAWETSSNQSIKGLIIKKKNDSFLNKSGSMKRPNAKVIKTSDSFSISPNPTVNMISIKANEKLKDPKVNVKLLDLDGKLILAHTFRSSHNRFGLQNLPTGDYVVNITSGSIKQIEKLTVRK